MSLPTGAIAQAGTNMPKPPQPSADGAFVIGTNGAEGAGRPQCTQALAGRGRICRAATQGRDSDELLALIWEHPARLGFAGTKASPSMATALRCGLNRWIPVARESTGKTTNRRH